MPELPGLDELRALQPGTPLPWHSEGVDHRRNQRIVAANGEPITWAIRWTHSAAYIVAAANALPGLLARLARAEQEREQADAMFAEIYRISASGEVRAAAWAGRKIFKARSGEASLGALGDATP